MDESLSGGQYINRTAKFSLINAQISWEELNLPCKDEWRQALQSPASTEDKIREWFGLKVKCRISGLYEYRMGVLYVLAGRYDEARTVTHPALAPGTPYQKYLLSVIANADLGQGNLDSSLLRYKALTKKYPEYYDGYAGVGAVKLVQHKFEESIEYLNEAAKRARTLDIYRNLTIAYAQLGRHEEAVKAMNDAYAIDKSIVKDRESMHAAAISIHIAGQIARRRRLSQNAGPGRSAGGKRSGNPQDDGLCVKKARGRKKIRQKSSVLSRAISACLMPNPARAAS